MQLQIVKKGNVYLIRTPNKTYTYKTLKGAKNKLSKLKVESAKQKQKQTQRQSVIVNVNTSKAKPSARKSVKAITQPSIIQPSIRISAPSTPFTPLEQFGQARPRSTDLIPSQRTQDELTEIKKTLNELRDEHLKLIESQNRDIAESLNSDEVKEDEFEEVEEDEFEEEEAEEEEEKPIIGTRIIRTDIPNVINQTRDETITSENNYGEPLDLPEDVKTMIYKEIKNKRQQERREKLRLQQQQQEEERELADMLRDPDEKVKK